MSPRSLEENPNSTSSRAVSSSPTLFSASAVVSADKAISAWPCRSEGGTPSGRRAVLVPGGHEQLDRRLPLIGIAHLAAGEQEHAEDDARDQQDAKGHTPVPSNRPDYINELQVMVLVR